MQSLGFSAHAFRLLQSKADLQAMGPKLNPLLGYYDPLGLTDSAYWGLSEEGTVGWLRQSEIKYVF
jgi:hypothetical protein